MKQILVASLFLGSLIATGCSSHRSAGNSNALLVKYMQDDSQTNLVNLSKAYGSQLSRTIRESRPQPGECAEYAVTLALLNQNAEANTWFNLEAYYYPTSTQYVEQLKLDLIPEFASDHSTDARDANLSGLGSNDDSADAAIAADNNQNATNTKVKLTKKEKKKLARQKAKAKKQAKREKVKAKKAKIKAKKKAKKQAAKAKSQAQKERKSTEE